MHHVHFEQLNRRRAALALADNSSRSEFSPYGHNAIRSIRFSAGLAERGVLHIETSDGRSHQLPGFSCRHAAQLNALAPSQRLAYLRDVWINYVAWRCPH